jgi:hypothetical protein
VTQLCDVGSNNPSLPGGVPLAQDGEKSQPGIATHTRPLPSNAVPHGSMPGTGYSVMLLIPAADAVDPNVPTTVLTARNAAAKTNAPAAVVDRIFLVLVLTRHLSPSMSSALRA